MPDDRTHEATPFKRQKAREKGQVARSRELPSSLALLAIVLILGSYAATSLSQWRSFFAQGLDGASTMNAASMLAIIGRTFRLTAIWTVPCLLVGFGLSVFGNVAQGGLVIATQALTPSANKLNPVTNLGKLFSVAGVGNFLKSVVPMVIVTAIAYSMVRRDWDAIALSSMVSARASIAWLVGRIFELSWKAAAVFLGWSGFDYLIQRTQLARQLRMSRQEITQENKDNLGNPQIKARIRKVQRQMRRRRMIREVAKATVVITNPTEYAIAIKYQPGVMRAPIVVAKGRGLLAQQIRREAVWHSIPIVENRYLAHTLYRAVQVGQAIPPALYVAMAEILAFIFRAQARAARTAAQGSSPAGRRVNQSMTLK
jgi:flagellar biosynthesis protein FlhB